MSDEATENTPGAGEEPPVRRPPGMPRSYLDQRERAEMLVLLYEGKGRDQALAKLTVPYRKFRNTYEDDEEFREAVRSAQRAAEQELDENGYMKAMAEFEGAEILGKVWDRRDRGRDLNIAREDKAKHREFVAQQKALDRAHQIELAKLRIASGKNAPPDSSAIEIALKVAALFVPHVDPARLPEITGGVQKVCSGGDGDAKSP